MKKLDVLHLQLA